MKMKGLQVGWAARKKTAMAARLQGKHKKLPFVTDLAVEEVSKPVGWVEKSGEVPTFAALQSFMAVGGALRGGERDVLGCMRVEPTNGSRWKQKLEHQS